MVKNHKKAPSRPEDPIRPGKVTDYFEISHLAGEVFSIYGDYTQILSGYLLAPSVYTYIHEIKGKLAGFLQVYLDTEQLGTDHILIADILSAAVQPEYQDQGVGTALFQHVLRWLNTQARDMVYAEVHLTVAHTNQRAMMFFREMGFELDGEEFGRYCEGQRALRMSQKLPSAKVIDYLET